MSLYIDETIQLYDRCTDKRWKTDKSIIPWMSLWGFQLYLTIHWNSLIRAFRKLSSPCNGPNYSGLAVNLQKKQFLAVLSKQSLKIWDGTVFRGAGGNKKEARYLETNKTTRNLYLSDCCVNNLIVPLIGCLVLFFCVFFVYMSVDFLYIPYKTFLSL